MFRPTGFRRIDRSEPIPRNIRSDAKICLVLVKPDGAASCATGATDKDALVKAYDPQADLLVLVWAGQWKTEAFTIDADDLALVYRTLPKR